MYRYFRKYKKYPAAIVTFFLIFSNPSVMAIEADPIPRFDESYKKTKRKRKFW